jgi:MFS family permease
VSALRARWRIPAPSALDPEQRTIVLISVLLGFESVLYSVITPVLPHYAHAFRASKPAIGVLAAAYPAGMLPGALLGGWIASRAGVRRTTAFGLLLFTGAIVAFGFGSGIVVLDVLRFVQGIACGCIWGGGLAWVIAIAPRERRGEVLGSVFASAIFGTLIGRCSAPWRWRPAPRSYSRASAACRSRSPRGRSPTPSHPAPRSARERRCAYWPRTPGSRSAAG